MEDTADIFDSSIFTLFAVPPIGFSTSNPDEPWVYTSPVGDVVKLWLPHPPADLYAALQANNLWLSAIFLADHISRGEISLHTAVCELGAGAGLPGITAARAGSYVLCTDYDSAEVVATIKRNYEYNLRNTSSEGTPEETSEGRYRWAVRGHTWGTPTESLLSLSEGGYDLLLADTLWSTGGHEALIDSVLALLRDGGTAHVAAGLHTGRGPVNRFMALAAARGLDVKKIREVKWSSSGGWETYSDEEREMESEGEVRGVVVYYTLHKRE